MLHSRCVFCLLYHSIVIGADDPWNGGLSCQVHTYDGSPECFALQTFAILFNFQNCFSSRKLWFRGRRYVSVNDICLCEQLSFHINSWRYILCAKTVLSLFRMNVWTRSSMPTASLVGKSGFTAIGQHKHMNFRRWLDARIEWLVAQAGWTVFIVEWARCR